MAGLPLGSESVYGGEPDPIDPRVSDEVSELMQLFPIVDGDMGLGAVGVLNAIRAAVDGQTGVLTGDEPSAYGGTESIDPSDTTPAIKLKPVISAAMDAAKEFFPDSKITLYLAEVLARVLYASRFGVEALGDDSLEESTAMGSARSDSDSERLGGRVVGKIIAPSYPHDEDVVVQRFDGDDDFVGRRASAFAGAETD